MGLSIGALPSSEQHDISVKLSMNRGEAYLSEHAKDPGNLFEFLKLETESELNQKQTKLHICMKQSDGVSDRPSFILLLH